MIFAAPIWLLLLVPWAALSLWLMLGRRPRVAVPFIELWQSTDAPPREFRASLRPPPFALVCLLLAMLLGLLAAAQPVMRVVHQDPIVPATTQKSEIAAPKNVGIAAVSARVSPRPAAMVRLKNQSDLTRATLQVQDEGREVELPPRGQSRDYFFDLAEAPQAIAVTLHVDDEFAADNEARLVRGQSWPKIEAISALPAEVQRMIDIYSRHRTSSDKSERVVITDNVFRAPATQPAIILPRVSETVGPAQMRVVDHPITASVEFASEVSADVAIAAHPGEGWTPIVSAGEKVLLAVRDKPARSVWVGFRSEQFARQPGFVVMWTNIFDWIGGGDDSPDEYRPDELDINFPDPATNPPDTRKQLASQLNRARTTVGSTEFSSHLLLAALGLVVLAAATLARPRGRSVRSHVSSQGLA